MPGETSGIPATVTPDDHLELTLERELNSWVSVSAKLDSRQRETLEEAVLVVGSEQSPLQMISGRARLPFEILNTETWTGELADELTTPGQMTRFSGKLASVKSDLYLFRRIQADGDILESFGLNLGWSPTPGLDLGSSYLNDISRTELIDGDEPLPALRLNARYSQGPLTVAGEYLQTERLQSQAPGPEAFYLSLSYQLEDLFGAPAQLQLGSSSTEQARNLDNTRQHSSLGLSRQLQDDSGEIGLEYIREESYDREENRSIRVTVEKRF